MARPKPTIRQGLRGALLLGLACLAGGGSAYVGESFLSIPGVTEGAKSGAYKAWIKFESQAWIGGPARNTPMYNNRRMTFAGPAAPRQGPGTLALALDKRDPRLKRLMEICASGAVVPELRYAESSDLGRPPSQWGKRPADIPAYFEYALKNVSLSCPVAADAPEQAFVLAFKDIAWLNYQGGDQPLKPVPAVLRPVQPGGKVKTFVLTFFGSATEVKDDQCPRLNAPPTENDYYALMSAEAAAGEKAKLASSGGPFNQRNGMCTRGPDKLNVCLLPGLVKDPGHVSPLSTVAKGMDLDGDGGKGIRAGVRRHENFVSPNGQPGVDNQMFRVDGCVPGLKRNGLLTSARMEMVRNGLISIIVQISGIDDERNDKKVDVTVLYSKDPMTKNAAGSIILPKYTFRVTDDPEMSQFFSRFAGRIENGVVITEPLDEITFFEGSQQRVTFHDARMRIELAADGTMKGVVAGYQDWREWYNFLGPNAGFERGLSYQAPGLYQAFKRAADGMRNPITGDYDGISAAYEFDGVPAFIPPAQQTVLLVPPTAVGKAR